MNNYLIGESFQGLTKCVSYLNLEFDAIRHPVTGKWCTLDRSQTIDNRRYSKTIIDEDGVNNLSKEEILQLARNYITLKKKVDSYNSELEGMKIK